MTSSIWDAVKMIYIQILLKIKLNGLEVFRHLAQVEKGIGGGEVVQDATKTCAWSNMDVT